jgi:hypothetical protein
MIRLTRFDRIIVTCGGFVFAACTSHMVSSSASTPQPVTSDYEIFNPTPCVAIAYTVDQAGLTSNELARIPSGVRLLIRVPPLHPGTHLEAHAIAPDGTDCERGYRIVVRRVES